MACCFTAVNDEKGAIMIKDALSLTYQDHTILIVDDNPTNLSAIAEFLAGLGINIRVAQDGPDALDLLKRVQVDLILLDVMMPGIDGYAVCSQLKRKKSTHDIPVIFMTALADTENLLRGFSAGAVDYITKPFNQAEVLARVTTHLRLFQVAKWQEEMLQMEQKKTKTLAALNTAKDKFFSILSHDLRAPFSSLMGNAELLTENISDQSITDDEILEIAQSIHISAKSAYDLLQNLLTWSRLQRGMFTHRPSLIYTWELVERAMALFAAPAASKMISLKNEVAPESTIYADQQMLDLVLRNLISNAVKFTEANGRVTIQARPQPAENQVAISVKDSGLGIPPVDIPKLFQIDANLSTRGTAQEPGTGLGLILCQEMVTCNGGQIWVESEEGVGSSFTFTTPANPSL